MVSSHPFKTKEERLALIEKTFADVDRKIEDNANHKSDIESKLE